MYALVHSPGEFLHSDCDVTLFRSYELAHGEMVRRFKEVVTMDGTKVMPPNEFGDVLDDEGYCVGVIRGDDAWVEDTECKWAIIKAEEDAELGSAPLDEEGFALTERWYCAKTSTWYPAGTTAREIQKDMEE